MSDENREPRSEDVEIEPYCGECGSPAQLQIRRKDGIVYRNCQMCGERERFIIGYHSEIVVPSPEETHSQSQTVVINE